MKSKKIIGSILLCTMLGYATPVFAVTKEETVYSKLDASGSNYKTIVSTHIENTENEELIKLVLIVSGLEIQENNRKQEEKLGVKVEHSTGEKCERCWMYNDHLKDGLCPRCKEVLEK